MRLSLLVWIVFSLWAGALSAQPSNVGAGLDWARKKCVDLGFKPGAERFGNCVLQLSRDEVRAPSVQAPSDQAKPTAQTAGQAAAKLVPANFKDCDECPDMVTIAAGAFLMGSKNDPFSNSPPSTSEQPQHSVTIRSFALGKFEVTQGQWYAVMGTLPSNFKGRTLPVEQVSWMDAQEFVRKLSAKTDKAYRLPTEAEWEYAARAGSQTNYFFGDDPAQLGRYAWFSANSSNRTHPVGEKLPNAFGLYDMLGNVWEWTEDCWNENYNSAPTDGSAWTRGYCSQRVLRGGSWGILPQNLRGANRITDTTTNRDNSGGFRVARDL